MPGSLKSQNSIKIMHFKTVIGDKFIYVFIDVSFLSAAINLEKSFFFLSVLHANGNAVHLETKFIFFWNGSQVISSLNIVKSYHYHVNIKN